MKQRHICLRVNSSSIKWISHNRLLTSWFILTLCWWKITHEICVSDMFILNSQMFTARKICQIRNHFDFKYSIFFVFSFFRLIPPARPMYIHNLLKPSGFFTQDALKLKRAPDLAWLVGTHFLARFVVFHFLRSVYIPAAYVLSGITK